MLATYIHHPGRQIGTVLATSEGSTASSGTWNYYFQDAIGSTRSLWDEDGERLGKYDYTPFGGNYSSAGQGITRKYTGHDWDSTARFYHTAYRNYSPDMGRWISRDPLGMVDGPNVYAYVMNNPVRYSVPMGTDLVDWVVTGYWNPAEDIAQEAYAAFWNDIVNPRGCGSWKECYDFCVAISGGIPELSWGMEHTAQLLGAAGIAGYDYLMMSVMRNAYSTALVNLLSSVSLANGGTFFAMAEWDAAFLRLSQQLESAGTFRTSAALKAGVYAAATFELTRRAACAVKCNM